MVGRWSERFNRGARVGESVSRAREAQTAMVSAFLDMDKRQTIASAAVDASAELYPERGLRAAWEPVRDRCFQAASDYLDTSERYGNDQVLHQNPNGARAAFEKSVAELVEAAKGVDAFYNGHRVRHSRPRPAGPNPGERRPGKTGCHRSALSRVPVGGDGLRTPRRRGCSARQCALIRSRRRSPHAGRECPRSGIGARGSIGRSPVDPAPCRDDDFLGLDQVVGSAHSSGPPGSGVLRIAARVQRREFR